MATHAEEPPDQPPRPRLIQHTAEPVFLGRGAGPFVCVACNHELVRNYEPRQLIAVDIGCFSCGAVSRTAEWPTGEPLPQALVTLGETGTFRVSTVDISQLAGAFTCNQEIARVRKASEIGAPEPTGIAVSADGLALLEAQLSLELPNFQTALRSTRNAHARGNYRFVRYPPAWALVRLHSSVQARVVHLEGADGVAIAYLSTMLSTLSRWRTHPRIDAIRGGFVGEFHHSLAQLVFASYLADVGNPIGFGEPLRGGGRSPDLFINVNALQRHSIEVKAPEALQWPNQITTVGVERLILDRARAARRQFFDEVGGMLVVGASSSTPEASVRIRQAIEQLCESGQVSRQISAIGAVCLSPTPHFNLEPHERLHMQSRAEVFAVLNPRYLGPTKIVIDPQRGADR